MRARDAALMGTAPLEARLKARIREAGPLSVEDYMLACLGDDEAGYYRSGDPLGRDGDFVTAPEVSQIFGELIGLWCVEMWRTMGAPDPFLLVELGPGRGTAIADMLRAAIVVPDFLAAARVHLVESNGTLRQMQATRLEQYTPHMAWSGELADVPQGPMILFANEFLDVLPIRQMVFRDGRWRERCVGLGAGGGLAWTDRPAVMPMPETGPADERDGAIVEFCPGVSALVEELRRRNAAHPVVALFVDYGYCGPGTGDTLQSVRSHQFHDPLQRPGEADLTAHVDFAALASAARSRGMAAWGPMTQSAFLRQLGLVERVRRLAAGADAATVRDIVSGAERLVSPNEMGVLFKVMALTHADIPRPLPFGRTPPASDGSSGRRA